MKNIKKQIISLLAITSLGFASSSFALFGLSSTTSAGLLQDFHKMKSAHTADWIDHLAAEKASFFKLIKNEQKECSKLHEAALKKFETLNGKNNEQIFNTILNDAIALRKSQKMEWANEHNKMEQKTRDLALKHDAEFNKFISKLGNLKSTPAQNEAQEVLLGKKVIGYGPDMPDGI